MPGWSATSFPSATCQLSTVLLEVLTNPACQLQTALLPKGVMIVDGLLLQYPVSTLPIFYPAAVPAFSRSPRAPAGTSYLAMARRAGH